MLDQRKTECGCVRALKANHTHARTPTTLKHLQIHQYYQNMQINH